MGMISIPVEPAVTEYLHKKAARLGIPLNGTFELTPVCNMSCKMCYVRMTRKQQESIASLKTAKEWLSLGKLAREKGMLYLLLTGGEPFLRPDFKEIMQGLHKMGFVLSVNSNGTLINKETVEWLKETPPVRINITMYGASDETYLELCGNPNGFSQVKEAIHLLKDAGISIKINCSATPSNIQDVPAIIDFCKKEQLIITPTAYMFPPLRRDESQAGKNHRFTPEEAGFYSARIDQWLNGNDLFLKKLEHQQLDGLVVDNTPDCTDTDGEGIHCRAGKCSFWITWDGRMLPCGMLPSHDVLNVFESGFDESWNKAKEISAAIRLPGKCAICQVKDKCKACAAMVYTESGHFDSIPEYRCKMTQEYLKGCLSIRDDLLCQNHKQRKE